MEEQLYCALNGDLQELLHQVIRYEDIRPVFQPIISLRDGAVLGYEALSRGPRGTQLEDPETLFTVAQKCDLLWSLELLCHSKALSAMGNLNQKAKLFLNVNPNVIQDAKFNEDFIEGQLSKFGVEPESIVFEITEKAAITNINEFKKIVSNYKGQDYQIAIDDAGAGYSGLNLISDVRPHYLKLDINLIRGIHKDSVKQALVKGMYEFSKTTGTYLIAEGVETLQELRTLIHIGVHYAQGYYIQKPAPNILPIEPEIYRAIIGINEKKNHIYGGNLSEIYIGHLCNDVMAVNKNVAISQAYDRLQKNGEFHGFCVTREDGTAIGVVTKAMISAAMGAKGENPYARKKVSSIMSQDFLSVDYKTPISVVGMLAMSRPDDAVYDFITVTENSRYMGIVTIKDLLNRTMEIKVTNATLLNPLTELPGNIVAEKALQRVLAEKDPRCVLYFDIDNFKAYNDVYGFANGDRLIKYLASIIRSEINSADFVGHTGGDDFIVITDPGGTDDLCRRIMDIFDMAVPNFYKKEDAGNGYIIAKNRHGFEEQYQLVSLSIAGISTMRKSYPNVFCISEEASRIRKECKQVTGSVFIIG